MKSFKNQNWLFLLVIFTINSPAILSWGFFDAEPETKSVRRRSLDTDSTESMTEMTDLAKERQEKEIQDRIERIKAEDLWKDNRIARSKKIFSEKVTNLVRNNPNLSDSEINDQANQATIQSIQNDFSDWEKVEKPTSPSLEKNTSVKNVGDIAQKAKEFVSERVETGKKTLADLKNRASKSYETVEAARKEVVKNFKDWLNDLVNPKNMTIKEAKENITNKRNENAANFQKRGFDSLNKQVIEKVTAQELKQRALKEVKEFEAQVGSLSFGSGDSAGVFRQRLQATQDIYTENAKLLQKQFDTYDIPKIVVAARPQDDLDPNNYTFNIIDLGQKELGSDQTLKTHLDRILTNDAIPTTFDSEKIQEFNEKLLTDKTDENIQNLKKEFLKISYEIKVRQNLDLTTPEIQQQLVEYVIKKKAQIAEDSL